MKLSQRVQNLGESATLAVTKRAKELQAGGVDVVVFGVGQPDFPTPAHVREAAKRALDEGKTGYAIPNSGLAETKEAIRGKLSRENGLNYDPSQLVVTVGGKEALFLAFMALLDEGDEVILPTPYWVSYPEQIKLAGGRPILIAGEEANGFRIAPEKLQAALGDKTRIVVLNYPSNPGGFIYNRAQLEALAEVLEGKDIVVFSDEIYDRLVYGDNKFVSWASLSEENFAKTVTFNAPSKTFSMTGWRLGYAAGPRDIIAAMAKLQGQTTSGTTNFGQYGLIAALNGESRSFEEMHREFDARRQLMYEGLSAIPDVSCIEPQGAFYCFPNVSATYPKLGVSGSVEFAGRLLDEAHVAVVPGAAFGCDDNIRLAYATNRDRIREGLERLKVFLR